MIFYKIPTYTFPISSVLAGHILKQRLQNLIIELLMDQKQEKCLIYAQVFWIKLLFAGKRVERANWILENPANKDHMVDLDH